MWPHSGSTSSRAPGMCSATSSDDGSGTTWSWPPASTRVGTRISPRRAVTNELGSSVPRSSARNRSGVAGTGWRLAAAAKDPAGGASDASPPGRIWSAIRAKNSPHSPRSPSPIHSAIRGAMAESAGVSAADAASTRRDTRLGWSTVSQSEIRPPPDSASIANGPCGAPGRGHGDRDGGRADAGMEQAFGIGRVVRDRCGPRRAPIGPRVGSPSASRGAPRSRRGAAGRSPRRRRRGADGQARRAAGAARSARPARAATRPGAPPPSVHSRLLASAHDQSRGRRARRRAGSPPPDR